MRVVRIIGLLLGIVVGLAIIAGAYIKIALPDTGDAPVLNITKTPLRLERGKYLANHVAVCMDCHSTREWNLYAGPMAKENIGGGGEVFNQDMGFPGTFYAPNITPYAISNWTDGEIFRAITTGVNKKGRALFPLMAYHRFGKMDEEDIYSIIAYIRTLKAVSKDIPASKVVFPVSILINTMPAKAAFEKIPAATDLVKYGGYLVNAAGCIDCHSKQDKGKVVEGTEFGGGMEFKQPGGIVRATNITFHKTGLKGWKKEDFVKRFKVYADSGYRAAPLAKGELNTPMPWFMFAGMKEQDLIAIYTYLKSLKPINNSVIRFEK